MDKVDFNNFSLTLREGPDGDIAIEILKQTHPKGAFQVLAAGLIPKVKKNGRQSIEGGFASFDCRQLVMENINDNRN